MKQSFSPFVVLMVALCVGAGACKPAKKEPVRPSISELIVDLKDKNERVKIKALRELARRPKEADAAIGALARTLEDPSSQVRKLSVEVALTLKKKALPLTPYLIEVLEDKDLNNRISAARSLVLMDNEEGRQFGVAALIEGLGYSELQQQRHACRSLQLAHSLSSQQVLVVRSAQATTDQSLRGCLTSLLLRHDLANSIPEAEKLLESADGRAQIANLVVGNDPTVAFDLMLKAIQRAESDLELNQWPRIVLSFELSPERLEQLSKSPIATHPQLNTIIPQASPSPSAAEQHVPPPSATAPSTAMPMSQEPNK